MKTVTGISINKGGRQVLLLDIHSKAIVKMSYATAKYIVDVINKEISKENSKR